MIKQHLLRAAIGGILALILAFVYTKVTTTLYEARGEILAGGQQSAQGIPNLSTDVALMLENGGNQGPLSDLQILRSEGVFDEAVTRSLAKHPDQRAEVDPVQLFLMYNVVSDVSPTVASQVQPTALAQIRVRAGDKEFAQDICSEIMSIFNEQRGERAKASQVTAVNYLQGQVNTYTANLKAAQQKYEDYKQKNGISDPNVAMQQLIAYQSNAKQRRDVADSEASAAKASYAELQVRLKTTPKTVSDEASSARNNTFQQVDYEIAQANGQLEELRKTYTDGNEQVQGLIARIKSLQKSRNQLKSTTMELQNTATRSNPVYVDLQSRVAAAAALVESTGKALVSSQAAYDKALGEGKNYPAQEAQLLDLRREIDVADLQYRNFKQQLAIVQNREIMAGVAAPIILSATALPKAVAPNVPLIMILGLVAGVSAGLLYSFALESLRSRAYNSVQLGEFTGLPVLSSVRRLTPAQSRTLMKSLPTATAKPFESFMFMANSLLSSAHGARQVIGFTGVGGHVGVSAAAAETALAMAKSGATVLLVDANLGRPRLTRIFDGEGKVGVTDLLTKDLLPSPDGESTSYPTAHDRLSFLPVGQGSRELQNYPNDAIAGVVASLKGLADVLILDLPPCDVVSDASRFMPYVDSVCLVVSATKTSSRTVPVAIDLLQRTGASNVQLVLTDVSPEEEPFGRASTPATA